MYSHWVAGLLVEVRDQAQIHLDVDSGDLLV